jgi:nucleotide-binding universal stress UspA family protein
MVLIRNIVVPTDFSEPASAAFGYAQALANQFGSGLHLLHVIAAPQLVSSPEGEAYVWPTFLPDLENAAREQLDRLARSVKSGSVVTAVRTGIAVDQILDYVAANGIDLILMGRGVIGHVLLGSVAERVIRHSPVPVLTVHAPAAGAVNPDEGEATHVPAAVAS